MTAATITDRKKRGSKFFRGSMTKSGIQNPGGRSQNKREKVSAFYSGFCLLDSAFL
jgi:hypothetical protein